MRAGLSTKQRETKQSTINNQQSTINNQHPTIATPNTPHAKPTYEHSKRTQPTTPQLHKPTNPQTHNTTTPQHHNPDNPVKTVIAMNKLTKSINAFALGPGPGLGSPGPGAREGNGKGGLGTSKLMAMAAAKGKAASGGGVDRAGIERNANGSEEPSSSAPELWNVDDCEVDILVKYKMGGQMWYVQSRMRENNATGKPIAGFPMNKRAEESGRYYVKDNVKVGHFLKLWP